MRVIYFLLAFFLIFISCKSEIKKEGTVQEKEKITSYNYNSLAPLLHKSDDTIYVINFWATWCKPCVKELPAFEKLQAMYKSKKVKVILISLDFPNQVESRLIPFIKKKNLQSKVILLNDPDQDIWIPKISEKWSGAIPATLIYNKSKRQFFEKSFSYEELEKEVHNYLK